MNANYQNIKDKQHQSVDELSNILSDLLDNIEGKLSEILEILKKQDGAILDK